MDVPQLLDHQTIASETVMEDSPLQRLPPELRNHIFKLALTADRPIKLEDLHEKTALIRTCKQIRQEGSAIFYMCNRFSFIFVQDTEDAVAKLCVFLRRLGPKILQHIGSLRVVIMPHYYVLLDQSYGGSWEDCEQFIDSARDQVREITSVYSDMGIKLKDFHTTLRSTWCVSVFERL